MQTGTIGIEEAQRSIAQQIGADAAEFTPAGEKHFFAEAALFDMAGSFLLAFLKAVAKRAAGKAEDRVGDAVGGSVSEIAENLLARLRNKVAPVPKPEIQAAREDVAAAVTSGKLSPAELQAIGQAVAEAMAKKLGDDADPTVAARVMEKVKVEGLKTIPVGA